MNPAVTAAGSRALVMAHYHSHGRLRSDTVDLLRASWPFFARTIFVSTNLDSSELGKFPASVEVHVRENVGYDFYSYRHGLLRLADDREGFANLEAIWLINSSFLCIDGGAFLGRLLEHESGSGDCFGLVKSGEIAEHLQSYMLAFKRRVLADPGFWKWWVAMAPLSDRAAVIHQYEIGLSGFLTGLGYSLSAAFDPDGQRAAGINKVVNPSHFHWLTLLLEFGVLKIEVIRNNPFRLDLRPLVDLANANPHLSDLIAQGLNN